MMADRPTSYRAHKRHKSSHSNVGYYFTPESAQIPQVQSSPIPSAIEGPGLYENDEAYGLGYSFPPKEHETLHNDPRNSHSSTNSHDLMKRNDDTNTELSTSSDFTWKHSSNPGTSQIPTSFFQYPQQLPANIYDPSSVPPPPPPPSNTSFPISAGSQFASSSFFQPQTSSSASSNVQSVHSFEPPNFYMMGSNKFPDFNTNQAPPPPHQISQRPQQPQLSQTPGIQALKLHQKNNLSISSHFNSFNIGEESKRIPYGQTSMSPVNTLNDLLVSLTNVDGSNLNNYLLSMLSKTEVTIPIDDFYNFLFNDIRYATRLTSEQKIDKTLATNYGEQKLPIFTEILNVFKNPNSIVNYFPDLINKENKLSNINYHELLRTFLAIKILYDSLIEIPKTSDKEPHKHTIPRLSIYKTYFIICQKLLAKYSLGDSMSYDHQKLILGQSKLGKLIKMVYPDLRIKRLGSRGESKYNYLGVVWNENIVDDEIKRLCDNFELVDLSKIFNEGDPLSVLNNIDNTTAKPDLKRNLSTQSNLQEQRVFISQDITAPSLSFIEPFLKYPVGADFDLLKDNNWFETAAAAVYSTNVAYFNSEFIKKLLVDAGNFSDKTYLLNSITNEILRPLVLQDGLNNAVLGFYFVFISETLPYMLMLKPSPNAKFLKNLRLNLLHLVSNLISNLSEFDGFDKLDSNESTIFLIMLKKLININDFLITYIKLIVKVGMKSAMSSDIENLFNNSDINTKDIQNIQNFEPSIAPIDIDQSFRTDVISNDLILTLIGCNFDPTLKTDLRSSLSMNFITQESNVLDEFFKKELYQYLTYNDISRSDSVSSKDTSNSGDIHDRISILTSSEMDELLALIRLISGKLLNSDFKAKYSILVSNNLISIILNDILKLIFLKQQQFSLSTTPESTEPNSPKSFGNWWVFNSFTHEFLSVLGEIVGLYDRLHESL